MLTSRTKALKEYLSTFCSQRQTLTSFSTYSSIPVVKIFEQSLSIDSTEIPFVWLRDHCKCPLCIHSTTNQKLHTSGSIPSTIKPVSILVEQEKTLLIKWNDRTNHTSSFSIEFLKNISSKYYFKNDASLFKQKLWVGTYFKREPIDYSAFMEKQGFINALQKLRDYGLCFLQNVPLDTVDRVEEVARRFGPLQDTIYGPSWNVKSVPNSKNIAYTSLYLGLHFDLMYFESPPGLQFFHCLENSTKGGESIFLDSFNAIEILKKEAPADFDILCRVPVTFEYENDGHHLRFTRPTISPGTEYDRYVVRYSPPFQGPLENTDCKLSIQFYSSMKKFEEILERKDLVFKTRLEPGDLVIFANQRVFHGREAFDPAFGHRHFRGTYVTNDDFRNRVRTNL